MDKLHAVKYILNHDDELLSWYCFMNGTKESPGRKDGFNMPEPDDLTIADVTTYGTGFWGDVADYIIDDGISRGLFKEEDFDYYG